MSKTEKFYRAMAWLCFGIIVGLFLSPVRDSMNFFGNDWDVPFDDDEEETEHDGEEIVLK